MRDDEDLLADYVAEALDRRDNGESIDPSEICAEHPHLAAAVADALGIVDQLPALHADSIGTDRWVGVTLSHRYELVERVGAGAMGAVYRARDRELDRDVAVKLLRHELFVDERSEQRFLREARSLAAVDHPHVVPVYDRGKTDDGVLFLVMAWIPGLSLAGVLELSRANIPRVEAGAFGPVDWLRDRLPVAELETSYLRQCVRWCAEIASALAAAHAAGIVHRDVKPSNVLITPSGRVVLCDFGIAARSDDGTLTAHGSSIGTPWYMAPEQAAGRHEPDPRSDVYSLGSTLFHLVALRPPFDDEPLRVLARVQTEDPPRLASLHKGLPRDLQAIAEHAMERRPSARYPDASTMESDLRAFLEHRPVRVRPLSPGGRAWRVVRRRPARAIATVASLAALVSIPVWRELATNAAQQERLAHLATLPALHTFESYPEKRAEVGAEERAQQFAVLNRILEIDPDDHATRVARMATFQDVGDHDAAARDAAEIGSRASSVYLVALADRYRASKPDAFGVAAVDLEDMPEPGTDVDRFVAAFHEIRMRKGYRSYQRALELLDGAQSYLPARDLRLIALLSVGEFQAAHDAAWQLEGVYGRPTARTRHVIGASCCYQRRYEDAIEPLKQALQLRPGRHGPLHNLGVAYKNLGRLDEAEQCFEQAHAVRPWIWNTLHEMSQVLTERGRFAEALEYARRIPLDGTLRESVYRPRAIAQVMFHWALDDYWTQQDVATEHARGAIASYDELLAQELRERERSSALRERALMVALVERDESTLLDRYLEISRDDPMNPLLLRSLARFLPTTPERLSPVQLGAIRELLEQQSRRLDRVR